MDKGIIHLNSRLTKLIFSALLFMSVGIALELYLLDHYEDALQLIPILCISCSLLVVVMLWFSRSHLLLLIFKCLLVLSVGSGLYGTFLHLKANYEFESEMNSKADFSELLVESFSGALPALAPGSMILFALIGYAYLIIIKQKQ